MIDQYDNPMRDMTKTIQEYARCIDLEQKKVKDLEAENTRLRQALEFYADPFSWRTRSGKVGITPLTNGEDVEVIDGQWTGGKKAREALKESV